MLLAMESVTLSYKMMPFICSGKEISVCLNLGEGHSEMSLEAQGDQKFSCAKGCMRK